MIKTCDVYGCRYETPRSQYCPKHKRDRPKIKIDLPNTGQLYVIHFATGMVKVGWSKQASIRVAQQTKGAWSLGVDTRETWQSEATHATKGHERELITWCVEHSTEQRAAEYFAGLDFKTTCDQAKQILR